MKKPAFLLTLLTFVGMLLGWSIGTFFTSVSVAKVVASIPASPIVTNVAYNKEKHSLTYEILNPGGMPLTIVEESFVFTPGKNSKEAGYIVSNIPVKIVLAPGVITKIELKLKKGTEKLKLGDALLSTFTYVTPISKDIYTIVHPFTMKKESTTVKQNNGGIDNE